jgi:hypothetical protein
VINSLTKLDCPISQTGLSGFGNSNSTASFVKFQNHLFIPPLGDIKGLSEALALLRHEADEQMVHSQYRHFLTRAEEGAEAMVLPARDHDRMRCFTDQVILTCALV